MTPYEAYQHLTDIAPDRAEEVLAGRGITDPQWLLDNPNARPAQVLLIRCQAEIKAIENPGPSKEAIARMANARRAMAESDRRSEAALQNMRPRELRGKR